MTKVDISSGMSIQYPKATNNGQSLDRPVIEPFGSGCEESVSGVGLSPYSEQQIKQDWVHYILSMTYSVSQSLYRCRAKKDETLFYKLFCVKHILFTIFISSTLQRTLKEKLNKY